MANTITKQTLVDDIRKTVVKITIVGDGSGEETNYVLYDASSYTHNSINNKLMKLEYALNGFTANLNWDATADVFIMNLLDKYPFKHCFEWFGGIINNSGTGKTGDILMTTIGLGAADVGTIILTVYKKIKNPIF